MSRGYIDAMDSNFSSVVQITTVNLKKKTQKE